MTQESPDSAAANPSAGKRIWSKGFLFFGIIAAWYGLSRIIPLDTWLLGVMGWIEGLGIWGPVIFILLYLPSCVLMFPDLVPNAAAGAIWGVGVGTVAASLGRMLGSAATFLVTRKIAGRWMDRKMAADPQFAAVSDALAREGFRFVVLLRLCPLFPVIMLNYALGLTRISLPAYALGTLIGMIPRTFVVAYIGAGTRSLADLASGDGVNVHAHPVLYWGGLALSLLIVILLAHKARKMINAVTRQP